MLQSDSGNLINLQTKKTPVINTGVLAVIVILFYLQFHFYDFHYFFTIFHYIISTLLLHSSNLDKPYSQLVKIKRTQITTYLSFLNFLSADMLDFYFKHLCSFSEFFDFFVDKFFVWVIFFC